MHKRPTPPTGKTGETDRMGGRDRKLSQPATTGQGGQTTGANTAPSSPESPSKTGRPVNILRASSIMACGTIVSRLLGFVRAALLIALIGALGANDAFQAANNLPNTIFNLLASSVLSAVLVPTIVQALKRDDEEFINRLLTLFSLGILLLTLLCVAIAPLLVVLFAAKLAPGWKALAIAFSYWCLPQVLFYGLYAMWGQFLNAKGIFGPYTWAPVVNNIVGILGLGVFVLIFGQHQDWAANPQVWTGWPIAVLGATTTLGIVIQALILLVPIHRTGFRLRLRFGFRGQGMQNVSKTALWAFLGLVFSQLGFLAVSNIAAAANGYATEHRVVIAATTARATTFMVFFIPQSTIVVSVVTALFTSLSTLVAAKKLTAAAQLYQRTQLAVAVLTVFFASTMFVAATPIMEIIMPSSRQTDVEVYAQVLQAFCLGIPALGFTSIAQRMALSLNDAFSMFIIQVPATLVLLAFCAVSYFCAPASWWVTITTLGEMAGYFVAGGLYHYRIHKRWVSLGSLRETAYQYGMLLVAGVVAGLVAAGPLHWLGAYAGTTDSSAWGHLGGAFLRCVLVGLATFIIYFGCLTWFRSAALAAVLPVIWRKLPGVRPLPKWIARYDQKQDESSTHSRV